MSGQNDPIEGVQELAYSAIYPHLMPSSGFVDLSLCACRTGPPTSYMLIPLTPRGRADR